MKLLIATLAKNIIVNPFTENLNLIQMLLPSLMKKPHKKGLNQNLDQREPSIQMPRVL